MRMLRCLKLYAFTPLPEALSLQLLTEFQKATVAPAAHALAAANKSTTPSLYNESFPSALLRFFTQSLPHAHMLNLA
jgi:hypothetical protein